jgi:hypothetical protein
MLSSFPEIELPHCDQQLKSITAKWGEVKPLGCTKPRGAVPGANIFISHFIKQPASQLGPVNSFIPSITAMAAISAISRTPGLILTMIFLSDTPYGE